MDVAGRHDPPAPAWRSGGAAMASGAHRTWQSGRSRLWWCESVAQHRITEAHKHAEALQECLPLDRAAVLGQLTGLGDSIAIGCSAVQACSSCGMLAKKNCRKNCGAGQRAGSRFGAHGRQVSPSTVGPPGVTKVRAVSTCSRQGTAWCQLAAPGCINAGSQRAPSPGNQRSAASARQCAPSPSQSACHTPEGFTALRCFERCTRHYMPGNRQIRKRDSRASALRRSQVSQQLETVTNATVQAGFCSCCGVALETTSAGAPAFFMQQSTPPHLVLEAVYEVCQLRQPVLLGAGGHCMLCLQQ